MDKDRRQMQTIIDTLRSDSYVKSGVIIVVFAHGWQHNASFHDPNVEQFRRILRRASAAEAEVARRENRGARKVAGVYLGWRGKSVPGAVLSNLSFWDRKNVASTVGHGGLTEFLLQLENVQIEHLEKEKAVHPAASTRLIVIGHSFGGLIVYSALSQIMLDRFVDLTGEPPETFGDLIVLVNPAFEAARYTPLRDASIQRHYPRGQRPLITIFTATNDDATRRAFPLGRWFSTFFDKYRDDFEKSANRTAIGHFVPYRTHELTLKEKEEKKDKTRTEKNGALQSENIATQQDLAVTIPIERSWGDITSRKGWSANFGNVVLTQVGDTEPNNPFYVVAVKDKELIDGHGGIWQPEFSDFLNRFILFSMRASE